MKKTSWKTTLGGILGTLAPIALAVWPQYPWIGGAIGGVATLIVGASARDNGVTSEQAGAK